MITIDLKEIEKRIEMGYISRSYNDKKNLSILNYTDKCTYDSAWDEFTKICRGLIIKEDGTVVAKCMPKFFNLFEKEESSLHNLPNGPFKSYTKADGSMIVSYLDDREIKLATRGSFKSDQALWAMRYIKENNISGFNHNYTYIFEVIYKENRIVTDYGDFEGLILLTAYDLNNGEELSREDLEEEAKILKIPIIDMHRFNNINEILDEINTWETLDEGFVVQFENGYRIKIKSKKYLEVLKKIIGMTPLSVWRHMNNGMVDRDFRHLVPEEFRHSLDRIAEELEKKYKDEFDRIKSIHGKLPDLPSIKDFAILLKDNFRNDFNPVISFHRGKNIEKYIMKKIRPKRR